MALMVGRMARGGLKAALGLGVLALLVAPRAAVGAQTSPCGPRSFTVYFEEWKAGLNPEGRDALTAAQRTLAGCEVTHVRIIGLAGAKGVAHDNQKLSEDRARTIADLLVAGGWPRERLETVAIGDRNAKVGDLDKPIRRRVRVEVQSRPQRARTAPAAAASGAG